MTAQPRQTEPSTQPKPEAHPRASAGGKLNYIFSAPTSSLRLHERAEEIPTIPPDEYDELLEDIETRGVLVPLDVLPMRAADGRVCGYPDEAVEIVVLDGRHRLNVAKTLGIEELPVRVVASVCRHGDGDEGFGLEGCPSHAFEYMVKAATMRRQLSTKQRRQLAEKVIISDPTRSDRSIAKTTGISHPTVARVRDDLEDEGQVVSVTTSTGEDGKEYPRAAETTAALQEPTFRPGVRIVTPPELRAAHRRDQDHVSVVLAKCRVLARVDPTSFIYPRPDRARYATRISEAIAILEGIRSELERGR